MEENALLCFESESLSYFHVQSKIDKQTLKQINISFLQNWISISQLIKEFFRKAQIKRLQFEQLLSIARAETSPV